MSDSKKSILDLAVDEISKQEKALRKEAKKIRKRDIHPLKAFGCPMEFDDALRKIMAYTPPKRVSAK